MNWLEANMIQINEQSSLRLLKMIAYLFPRHISLESNAFTLKTISYIKNCYIVSNELNILLRQLLYFFKSLFKIHLRNTHTELDCRKYTERRYNIIHICIGKRLI